MTVKKVEKNAKVATKKSAAPKKCAEKKCSCKKSAAVKAKTPKYVYEFGAGKVEGDGTMKPLLGGKGANLADMAGIGLPVPPGFTITTEACAKYYELGETKLHALIDGEISAAMKVLEKKTGKTFGYGDKPLLVSVRSGAAVSMPGMMDTVLNLGLNPDTVKAMIDLTNNPRFVWDSYRRFIQMFGNVVLGIEHELFEHELSAVKNSVNVVESAKALRALTEHDSEDADMRSRIAQGGERPDSDLSVDELQEVVRRYMELVKRTTGEDFPTDAHDQLRRGINAVFGSWNNPRAIKYRQLNDIRGLLGTAVNVQTMVFGNSGSRSGTGVAFTRDPSTGAHDFFYGEFLINAQGEDVVAGIRTPQQITLKGSRKWAHSHGIPEETRRNQYPSLEEAMPGVFKQLDKIRVLLEKRYRDMQDMEFTIDDGRLYMLQTRNGKRTAAAAVKIATDLVKEGMIDEKTAVLRVDPGMLDQLLHPVFAKSAEAAAQKLTIGLPASPGAATGQIVFHADDAEKWAKDGKMVILCREETSPEDISGMNAAQGILTTRGGMTSHAAVVARGMGKCCVAGAGDVEISAIRRTIRVGDTILREGDWISLNGSTGTVYKDRIATEDAKLAGPFSQIMALADKYRKLGVRTNADTPTDAQRAVAFGAEGIGLCRTEHMFFQGSRIISVRRMILVAETVKVLRQSYNMTGDDETRRAIAERLEQPQKQYNQALAELLPLQRSDFVAMFKALKGKPCTVRLLDPPLHEFLPQNEAGQAEMAREMGLTPSHVAEIVKSLHETNPMLGHRGCRLGISYPEVTQMQVRAICEAAIEVKASKPEIMVPLIGSVAELRAQKEIITRTINEVCRERKVKLSIPIGTMIEVPRAAITADQIAQEADFFSFGTNDLTQMTLALSRDDTAQLLGDYVSRGFYEYDPFAVLDQEGVGQLLKFANSAARERNPKFKTGVCGEHGGEPHTIEFCHRIGLTYVSCSPYRVPIARLAAAQAALRNE